MHPILISQWGVTLYSFGLLVGLGFAVGLGWTLWRAKQSQSEHPQQTPEHYMNLLMVVMIASLIGARLLYAIYYPSLFWADPVGVLFARGGLVWYGGVAGGLIAIGLMTWLQRQSFWLTTATIAPAAMAGLALGRLGCFLAGCCYGAMCHLPWAVQYPENHPTHGMLVHPAPLYESFGAVLIAVILSRFPLTFRNRWLISGVFLIGYGLLRFGLEFLRGDRLLWWPEANLSASQLMSLAAGLMGVALLVWHQRQLSSRNLVTG